MAKRKLIDVQQVNLMRQQIAADKAAMCAVFDHYDAQLEALLPPEDDRRSRRMKRYSRKNWADFLDADRSR